MEHEADTGFEIFGGTIKELFQNAAAALFSVIVDAEQVDAEKGKRLDLSGNGELLVIFLNELLFFWDTEGFIPVDFSLKIEDGRLTGTVIGGMFDPSRHTAKQEVKAVTYHKFLLKEGEKGFSARIILDI